MSRVKESISFLGHFLANPARTGAVSPSSRYLARALVEPLAACGSVANILELGAGTGAVTRHIAAHMGPADQLDICEANPALAEYVRQALLRRGPLQQANAEGRVRIFDQRVQDVAALLQYDFIICGLPLTAFSIKDARAIMSLVKRHAKPHGIFSYFEYIGIRGMVAAVRPGAKGKSFRRLSAFLDREIASHQIGQRPVVWNIPPALARHLRFEPTPANTPAAPG